MWGAQENLVHGSFNENDDLAIGWRQRNTFVTNEGFQVCAGCLWETEQVSNIGRNTHATQAPSENTHHKSQHHAFTVRGINS